MINPHIFWKNLGGTGQLLLGSAILFSIVRSFLPVTLGWDAGVQMQSAYRLIQGLGLTTIVHAAPEADLARHPLVVPLSHWPPGYSCLLAGLIKLGVNGEWSIKIICLFSTVLGWLGWSQISTALLDDPELASVKRSRWLRWTLFLLPIFMTPSWRGTDIIDWAAIPYVIILLERLISENWKNVRLAFGLGLLVGGMYAFRYAATFVFVGCVMVFLLAYLARPNLRLFSRMALFVLGFSLFWLPVHWHTTQQLGLADLDATQFNFHHLRYGFGILWENLSHSTLELWPWLPNKFRALFLDSLVGKVLTFPITPFLFLLPLLLSTKWRSKVSPEAFPYLLIFSCLIVADIAMIVVETALTGWPEVIRESRYYFPVYLPFWFMIGDVVLVKWARSNRNEFFPFPILSSRFLRFTLLSVAVLGALIFGFFFIDQINFKSRLFSNLLNKTWSDNFGSEGMKTHKAHTQAVMIALAAQEPDSIFYIEDYAHLAYNLADPVGRYRPIPPAPLWNNFYSSQDIQVYWIVEAAWDEHHQPIIMASGSSQEVKALEKSIPFEPIQEIPEEEVIIYRSNISANTHFVH